MSENPGPSRVFFCSTVLLFACERPLTLTLSPEYRGEGTGRSQRANDIPILNPACDAHEPPVADYSEPIVRRA